jgi:hypothetical protein
MKLDGLEVPVGRGGALVALDQGLKVAGAADDGEQWLRGTSVMSCARERRLQ